MVRPRHGERQGNLVILGIGLTRIYATKSLISSMSPSEFSQRPRCANTRGITE